MTRCKSPKRRPARFADLSRGVVFLAGTLAAVSAAAFGSEQGVAQDFVGKKLPVLELRVFYNCEPFNQGSLHGHKWVLALVLVDSKAFRRSIPLLESLHRPLKDGGPVVLAYGRLPEKRIRQALQKLPAVPSFPITSDYRFVTHRKLRPGSTYPFYYLVDESGIVVAQGPDSPEIHTRLKEFCRPQAPSPPPAETPPSSSPLPADYRNQVEEALAKDDIPDQVRLLRMAYRGSDPPQQEILQNIWRNLDEKLELELIEVRELLAKTRYRAARKRLISLRQEFATFPPAQCAEELWKQVADSEGSVWFQRAQSAEKKGDVRTARKELNRILKYYEDTDYGARARELLRALDES